MKSAKYTAGIIVLSIIVFGMAYKMNKEIAPHRNPIDQSISLNKNRPVTPGIAQTDPKFKDVAFGVETPERSPFSNQLAAVAKSIESFALPKKDGSPKERGSWIWTPTLFMTPEYIEEVLSGAESYGINAIYLSIDSYLDVFTMANGEEKEALKKEFEDRLDLFIGEANKRGIAVDAEAGWQDWGEEGNIYKAFVIVNFVKNFNSSRVNKFRGFQYDVEPYLLSRYQEDKESVLKNFVKLIDETEVFLSDTGLRFSVVLPDFFDGKDLATPKFSHKGAEDYAFGHVLSILDRRPDNSIIVMSYRNFAKGEDGSIEISQNEMDTAKRRARNTKVIIAQETGEFPPLYITFHHTSQRYLARQINELDAAFSSHPNFGGLAFHYINALIDLK